MSAPLCSGEPAVLRAVRVGWIDDQVRAHVDGCVECAELLELAGLLDSDRRDAMNDAHVPPAGALWFQMKLRAAREAQVRSARTTRFVQGASLLVALVVAVVTFGVPSPADLVGFAQPPLHPWTVAVLAGSALFALVAPIAVWLALVRSGS